MWSTLANLVSLRNFFSLVSQSSIVCHEPCKLPTCFFVILVLGIVWFEKKSAKEGIFKSKDMLKHLFFSVLHRLFSFNWKKKEIEIETKSRNRVEWRNGNLEHMEHFWRVATWWFVPLDFGEKKSSIFTWTLTQVLTINFLKKAMGKRKVKFQDRSPRSSSDIALSKTAWWMSLSTTESSLSVASRKHGRKRGLFLGWKIIWTRWYFLMMNTVTEVRARISYFTSL